MSNLMIFLFVLQIVFAILLIAIVLLQSSEEDALSGIGGSIGSSSILSHKSSVDLVTKITIILGCCLILNSLALTVISKNRYSNNKTIIEDYLKKQTKEQHNQLKQEKNETVENTDTITTEEQRKDSIETNKETENKIYEDTKEKTKNNKGNIINNNNENITRNDTIINNNIDVNNNTDK